jgi:hypothetical protein
MILGVNSDRLGRSPGRPWIAGDIDARQAWPEDCAAGLESLVDRQSEPRRIGTTRATPGIEMVLRAEERGHRAQ